MAVATWIGTLRLRTLPAAAAPVIVGAAYAQRIDAFALWPALAALVAALLIQIGTNLANDHFDHKKGADTADRAGPVRASAAGLLPTEQVRNAAYAAFALAGVLGLYLVFVGGWPILAIGLASILSGLAYTAGPAPLAYKGLADLWVLVFFGPVAVAGTVYVQSGTFEPIAAAWGIALGLLATAILVVNNLRDRPTDARANKNTLAVRFGDRFSQLQWTACVVGAFAVAFAIGHVEQDLWLLLPVAAAVLAAAPARRVWGDLADRRTLNPALGSTARVLLIYAVLLAVAL